MATKTRVTFKGKEWGRKVLYELSKEQSQRLATYAIGKTESIGNSINAYMSANNMDRTGNLLDSLCWAVFRDGKLEKFGFYRPQQESGDSHLHEWSRPMGKSVNGHVLAQNFIATYKPKTTKGWEVFLATLAPYWGYWEKGHVNIASGDTQKWEVMTMHYDVVKQDLTPARVTFDTYIPSN